MWDWYNRPGSWQDRANVPVRRLALLLIAAGVLIGVLFFVLYLAVAPHLHLTAEEHGVKGIHRLPVTEGSARADGLCGG